MKTKILIMTAPILALVALCGCGQAGNNPRAKEPVTTSPSDNHPMPGSASNMATNLPALRTNNIERTESTNLSGSNIRKQ